MLNRLNAHDYETPDDLRADCELLELSDVFDARAYRAVASVPPEINAAEHYLIEGWRRGLEPGPHFDGHSLYPYYCTVGFSGPPALTYLMLSASGPSAYRRWADAETAALLVRNSSQFDAGTYVAQLPNIGSLDAAMHYVLVGEQLGYSPSPLFDPSYYKERNPDVAMNVPNALVHYLLHGCHEGRRPVSGASMMTFDLSGLNPARESVLLISHEASRTGAPILAYNLALRLREKYNVIALLLRGGDLVADFQACCAAVIGPLTFAEWHPVEAKRIVGRVLGIGKFTYAIANSIESRHFLPWLPRAFVPVVSLVHEFASYTRPRDTMIESLDWATELVFSTELTAASAKAEHPTLLGRVSHILPQGRCELPSHENQHASDTDSARIHQLLRPQGAEDALIVLGAGFVHIRKGVDLFIACAAMVKALRPKRKVRFVWIGQGYDPENDVAYSSYLAEQISRSDLEGHFQILDEIADLDPLYAETGLFFLSSRLDPLPNVTIDAAFHGIPVICFEGASGIAEIIATEAATRPCVVPYLDVSAAAHLIADLANDDLRRAEISEVTRSIATKTFDMDRYVAALDRLGTGAVAAMRQRALDYNTLVADPLFDPTLFLRWGSHAASREEAIIDYLGYWAAVGLSPESSKNASFRRPCAGFHPQIYAHENIGRYSPLANPFADYLRRGRPVGPWVHDLIVPANQPTMLIKNVRIGLHSHFYYPELAADLLDKLAVNKSSCDLFFTTGSEAKANVLRDVTSAYDRGNVVIRIVPNRGRDIGAFLSALGDEILRYDIIGHLHGKRSIAVDELMGDTWREFLWQNLVGGVHPMLDIIARHFVNDERLGLVFSEDPHMVGWGSNFEVATDLAQKMGITKNLPPFFDFPIGTMFWARPKAIRPLLDLGLRWEDYPEEPVPYDGTILHALERLVPFAAERAGYGFATTHVPGITR